PLGLLGGLRREPVPLWRRALRCGLRRTRGESGRQRRQRTTVRPRHGDAFGGSSGPSPVDGRPHTTGDGRGEPRDRVHGRSRTPRLAARAPRNRVHGRCRSPRQATRDRTRVHGRCRNPRLGTRAPGHGIGGCRRHPRHVLTRRSGRTRARRCLLTGETGARCRGALAERNLSGYDGCRNRLPAVCGRSRIGRCGDSGAAPTRRGLDAREARNPLGRKAGGSRGTLRRAGRLLPAQGPLARIRRQLPARQRSPGLRGGDGSGVGGGAHTRLLPAGRTRVGSRREHGTGRYGQRRHSGHGEGRSPLRLRRHGRGPRRHTGGPGTPGRRP
ncbi:hypothetical protein IPZ70_36180, partial [Streptomyces polychromogenes]|nr:hypothetical protein [Streptomyces polychromogenes]